MSIVPKLACWSRRRVSFGVSVAVSITIVGGEASGQAQWSLTEDLRIGTGETEATTFADVRGIAVGTGGRIFVLDYRVQEIRAFHPSGKFVSNIARRGQGPGEISDANGLGQAPDGTIWVNDPANSRFSLFKPDGSFLRQHVVPIGGHGFIWAGTVDTHGNAVDPVFDQSATGEPVFRIRRISPHGVVSDAMDVACGAADATGAVWRGRSKTGGTIMSVPFTPSPRVQLDPRGFVWCTPSNVYRVVRVRLNGTDTVAVAERRIAPVPVTAQERAAVIARTDSTMKRYETSDADYSQIPKSKPFIDALDVDDAGRLWVRRPTTEPMTTVFDVFDEKGAFLATVRAPFKISPYWHPVIRGNVMYTVVLDEDDVQNVVRARIRR